MADDTGKDMPATEPKGTDKSAGKSGAVKPPVLEGTARPAAGVKAAPHTDAGKAEGKPGDKAAAMQAKSRPEPEGEAAGGGNAWLAGLLGGVLGLGAAYGLAWYGLWPTAPQPAVPADPRLAQFATAIPELETVTSTVQDELSTLTSRVGAVESRLAEAQDGPATTADPALAEQLAALSARLDEIVAATGGENDNALVAQLQADLSALREEAANTRAQLEEARAQVSALAQSTQDTAGAEAATIRLPLIFSGLETAFDSGRSYETELSALRQAVPGIVVPEALSARAATGLPRPEMVAAQVQAALPDLLAGRPASADASWQEATADWFRGLVAMRPAGAVEGDTPDAMVARLEAAVARRDFVAAQRELAALPDTMQRGAEPFAADIASLAAAQSFLADLRQQVLTGEAGA